MNSGPGTVRPIPWVKRGHGREFLALLTFFTLFQVGDVIILQDDNLIPLKWPLGRIVEVHPGSDGLVRVVQVKTSAGIIPKTYL